MADTLKAAEARARLMKEGAWVIEQIATGERLRITEAADRLVGIQNAIEALDAFEKGYQPPDGANPRAMVV